MGEEKKSKERVTGNFNIAHSKELIENSQKEKKIRGEVKGIILRH